MQVWAEQSCGALVVLGSSAEACLRAPRHQAWTPSTHHFCSVSYSFDAKLVAGTCTDFKTRARCSQAAAAFQPWRGGFLACREAADPTSTV